MLGPILTTQEAIKQFGFEEGRIINISSLAGSHSLPNGVLYSATKAAVENLTEGLSAELGSRRIRVNAIAPGYTRNDGIAAEVRRNALRLRAALLAAGCRVRGSVVFDTLRVTPGPSTRTA